MKIITNKISSKLRLMLFALGLFVLVAISFVYFKQEQRQSKGGSGRPYGWGQRPGGAQDFGGPPKAGKKPRWRGPIPQPPKEKIAYYKGLWAGPWFYPEEYTGQKLEMEKYGKWGVNIINIQPGFEINSKGEVRYPPDFPTYEDLDARIGELATKFYQANVHLGLTLILTYKKEFSEGKKEELWAGEPQPFPKEIIEQPGYLNKFNKVVEDMAKIAEKYHVYFFSPMGEPDGIFGMNVAPLWTRQIIPFVRKNYTGKLYYKGDLHKGDGDKMEFKGYDILGFVFRPTSSMATKEELTKIFDADMDRAVGWAKKDKVPQVVISEHGYLGNNQMVSAENIGLALEKSSKKLNGIFLTEPLPAVFKTPQGDQIVEQIKKWFLNLP